MTAPIPAERRLEKLLADQARRLGKLEARQRATQLGYSSLQDAYIKAYDAQSQVRMLLGRQDDGTFGVQYVNGPKPPRPAGTVAGARQLAILIGWDGTFEDGAPRPGDVVRMDVHVSEDGPDFEPTGLTVVGQLLAEGSLTVAADNVTHWVKLVAVTSSDVASDPTEAVAVLPLPAGQIAAGVVGAEQLAAQIVLATRIILGDPDAGRLEIDEGGITQFTDSGQPTIRLGADPTSGNYLTIVDPTDPDVALATISSDGTLTAQRFAVFETLNVGGEDVSAAIDGRARGIVAWGSHAQAIPATTTETGVMELEVITTPGRMYEIHTVVLYSWQPSPNAGELRLHYTLDGARPTISSPTMAISARGVGEGGAMNVHALISGSEVPSNRLRLLLSYASIGGPLVEVRAAGNNGFRMWVNDIGPDVPATGIYSQGGGSGGTAPPPPKAAYTTEWACTWSGSWNGNGTLRFGNEGDMVQGYYSGNASSGDNHAAFGFDKANIQATLAGAEIVDVGLWLYAKHWYYNSGGFARIRTHNGIPNAVYPGVSGTRWTVQFGKPEGKWTSLGPGVGDEFRDGLISGFALDARDVARNLADYGKFDGRDMGGRPRLSITYRK